MTGQSLGQLKALFQHLSETQRALETEVSAHEAILSSVRLTLTSYHNSLPCLMFF
jgi:hypothetical protein